MIEASKGILMVSADGMAMGGIGESRICSLLQALDKLTIKTYHSGIFDNRLLAEMDLPMSDGSYRKHAAFLFNFVLERQTLNDHGSVLVLGAQLHLQPGKGHNRMTGAADALLVRKAIFNGDNGFIARLAKEVPGLVFGVSRTVQIENNSSEYLLKYDVSLGEDAHEQVKKPTGGKRLLLYKFTQEHDLDFACIIKPRKAYN